MWKHYFQKERTLRQELKKFHEMPRADEQVLEQQALRLQDAWQGVVQLLNAELAIRRYIRAQPRRAQSLQRLLQVTYNTLRLAHVMGIMKAPRKPKRRSKAVERR